MTDKGRKYLSDILNSIDHILAFTKDISSFYDYKRNFLVKGAVERHLSIIGEAVNKYLKTNEIKLTHTKQIISLRNSLFMPMTL